MGECRTDAPHHLPSCWHAVQGVLRGVNRGAHDGAHGRGLTRWACEWAAVALQDARALPVVHVVGWEGTQCHRNSISNNLSIFTMQSRTLVSILHVLMTEFTFPEAHATVIPRRGQQRAGDVPAHAPHLRVVVVKLSHNLHLKLGGSRRRALLPVWRITVINTQANYCRLCWRLVHTCTRWICASRFHPATASINSGSVSRARSHHVVTVSAQLQKQPF